MTKKEMVENWKGELDKKGSLSISPDAFIVNGSFADILPYWLFINSEKNPVGFESLEMLYDYIFDKEIL